MSDDVNYKDLMIAKALTKEELNQEAVWAEQFERWWDAEGQYHRAGGNDYCKTFAWWAWLNREKSKQAEIYELQKRIDEYKKLTTSIRNEFDLWSDDSEFADVIEAQIENLEALRGENESKPK